MTYHGRVGPAFADLWTKSKGAELVTHVRTIADRIKTQASGYTPADFRELKTTVAAIVDAQAATVLHEFNVHGTGKHKTLQVWHFGLGIPADNQAQHHFLCTSYTMRQFHFHRAQQFMPLSVVGPHLALRKISARQGEVFAYDPRFVYVMAAALIIARAIESGQVHPESAKNILIPTHNGLYAGRYEPMPPFAGTLNRWMQYDMNRSRTWNLTGRGMAESGEVPERMVVLLTTIPVEKFYPRDHVIAAGLRAILHPAKESGLLKKLCLHYVDPVSAPLTEAETQQSAQMVADMTALMNGPEWLDAALHKGRVNPSHAPSAQTLRHA